MCIIILLLVNGIVRGLKMNKATDSLFNDIDIYFKEHESYQPEEISDIQKKISEIFNELIIKPVSNHGVELLKGVYIQRLDELNNSIKSTNKDNYLQWKPRLAKQLSLIIQNNAALDSIFKEKVQLPVIASQEGDNIQKAMEMAGKDGLKVAKEIQSLGISDQQALLAILKTAAYQNPKEISSFIQNFGIKNEDQRIEVAEIIVATGHAWEVCKEIDKFQVTDPEKLLGFAKFIAERDSTSLFRFVKNFGFNEEQLVELVKIGLYCDRLTCSKIKLLGLSQASQFMLAKILAKIPNIDVFEYLQYFDIVKDEQLLELFLLSSPPVAHRDRSKEKTTHSLDITKRPFQENELQEMDDYRFFDKHRTPQTTPSALFNDADVILYPADYKGVLPLNGIKRDEFEEITRIYQDEIIPQKLFQLEGSDEFKNTVLESFKLLLTRPGGRAIIKNLSVKNKPLKIIEYDQGCWMKVEYGLESVLLLDLNILRNGFRMAIKTPQGKKRTAVDQNTSLGQAVRLGHELTHYIHYLDDPIRYFKDFATRETPLDKDFSHVEEQRTISGWGANLPSHPITTELEQEILEKGVQEEVNELFGKENDSLLDYDSKNENALRSQFFMRIRSSDEGLNVKGDLRLLPNQEVSDDIANNLAMFLFKGYEQDFENFLLLNKEIDFTKITYNKKPFNLFLIEEMLKNVNAKTYTETYLKIRGLIH